MSQREILHVDMDAFFVSVEEVRDPSLKGKPVVVGQSTSGGGGNGPVKGSSNLFCQQRSGLSPALGEGRAESLRREKGAIHGQGGNSSRFDQERSDLSPALGEGRAESLRREKGAIHGQGGNSSRFDQERSDLSPALGEGRGVVAAASYEARKYGVHSAMPLAKARRLCPHAIFLPGSHGLYREFSERIFALLEKYSPLVEPVSLDEAYLDLTGCQKLHGPVLETAERIRNEIKATVGINASIGIASNKLLAKIASDYAKPNGLLWIIPGKERKFLQPLPVTRLPGVGRRSGEELRRMGVKMVAHLAMYPRKRLERMYGKWGTSLYFKSRGICDSPVLGEREDSRSISRETTLETDSMNAWFLESALSFLVEKAALQLRSSRLYARTVTLKLRTSDFTTVTRSCTLPEPACEDHVIFQATVELFRKWFTRSVYVRLIGVSLSSLTPSRYTQAGLFQEVDREQWEGLYRGIDRIRNKYGFRSILRGTSVRND